MATIWFISGRRAISKHNLNTVAQFIIICEGACPYTSVLRGLDCQEIVASACIQVILSHLQDVAVRKSRGRCLAIDRYGSCEMESRSSGADLGSVIPFFNRRRALPRFALDMWSNKCLVVGLKCPPMRRVR
jgi:hypothetical protein